MSAQIEPFMEKGSLLDFGCGDGAVGEMLSKRGLKVALADIYKHPNIEKTGLEFKIFKGDQTVPFDDNKFDNIIALTVFHHSDIVLKTLKEVHRMAKPNGRVAAIESVYGVDGREVSEAERKNYKNYFSIGGMQQAMVNAFFDHFYNRIIHYSEDPKMKVNVPFNFTTVDGWKKIFEKTGFVQEKMIHLGMDQPAAPEYHTLHILRAKK